MTRESGSDFHLPLGLVVSGKKTVWSTGQTLLASGRACLKAIIRQESLAEKTILIPAYLCDSVLLPLQQENMRIIFYTVTKKLEIDEKDLLKKIKKENPSAVLIIHYFGWIQPNIQTICAEIKKQTKQQCIIIEDLVQTYLTEYSPSGDYWFNSYRKFLPVADGAFLGGKKIPTPLPCFPAARILALLLKNSRALKPLYRALFTHHEQKAVNGKKVEGMSRFSKYVLARINESAVKNIRRANYEYLAQRLGAETTVKMFHQKLPAMVCPLGLPIIAKNRNTRDALQKYLIGQRIYCPVHWKLPPEIRKKEFPESHAVSEQILTIPIDQRYTQKDMERIAQCLKK